MRFYNGQPVVCINDRFQSEWWRREMQKKGLTLPTRDHRYTVRGYSDGPDPPCILLVEIANPPVMWSDGKEREAAFVDKRFAPITDISELEKIAATNSAPKRRGEKWDNRRVRVKEKT